MAKTKRYLLRFLGLSFIVWAYLWASGEDYKLAKAEDLRRSVETCDSRCGIL